jgi:hypothetical protein
MRLFCITAGDAIAAESYIFGFAPRRPAAQPASSTGLMRDYH